MYNIAKDSLFQPRLLVQYRNKSGWYAFFYLLILALFMTISAIVFFAGYRNNSEITSASTGCGLDSQGLVCDGSSYDQDTTFHLYGYTLYFLDEASTVSDLPVLDEQSIVIQGRTMTFYFSSTKLSTLTVFSSDADISFDRFFQNLNVAILISSIFISFLGNIFLLVFISLVSTIPFIRLKKFIPFKKIYKLIIFAITPIAFLMTFYNLLNIPELFFFILMFIGYRSIFLLQRELYFQTMLHLQDNPPGETIDTTFEGNDEDKEENNDDQEDS